MSTRTQIDSAPQRSLANPRLQTRNKPRAAIRQAIRLKRKGIIKNLLRGAASVLQIAPTRKRGLRELLNGVDLVMTDPATGQQRVLRLFGSDREALANDWRAVGADIRDAIGELKSETTPNA